MSRIHTILASIATEIADEMHDNTRDEREDRLIEELDSALTYYSTQWDILNEARPSTFELEQLGELAKSPAELAFDILYSTFLNEYWGALEDVKRVPEPPRTCSVTGKGMHSGWCWGDGDFYTSTEEITLKELENNRKDIFESLSFNGYAPTVGDPENPEFKAVVKKLRNEQYIPTEDLLTLAYGLGILYWTEWETEE